MARCTGTPTSTFGGGGGTKLFCSQALNATATDVTNTMRDIAPARSRTHSFILKYAGVRACLISVPHLILALEKAFQSESGGPPSHENSNNLLAVEPESENDAARSGCFHKLFQNSLRLKRRLKPQRQRIYSNVPYVEA